MSHDLFCQFNLSNKPTVCWLLIYKCFNFQHINGIHSLFVIYVTTNTHTNTTKIYLPAVSFKTFSLLLPFLFTIYISKCTKQFIGMRESIFIHFTLIHSVLFWNTQMCVRVCVCMHCINIWMELDCVIRPEENYIESISLTSFSWSINPLGSVFFVPSLVVFIKSKRIFAFGIFNANLPMCYGRGNEI